MPTVEHQTLPADSLLLRYRSDADGTDLPHYTDCFSCSVQQTLSLGDFIYAFYTSTAFRPERWLLGINHHFRVNNEHVTQLAAGTREEFAAWTVEDRTEDQLLMKDKGGRTRSWLMVIPSQDGISTTLLFGSAVTAIRNRKTGVYELGTVFNALLGFHRLYSRLLLRSACHILQKSGKR